MNTAIVEADPQSDDWEEESDRSQRFETEAEPAADDSNQLTWSTLENGGFEILYPVRVAQRALDHQFFEIKERTQKEGSGLSRYFLGEKHERIVRKESRPPGKDYVKSSAKVIFIYSCTL